MVTGKIKVQVYSRQQLLSMSWNASIWTLLTRH